MIALDTLKPMACAALALIACGCAGLPQERHENVIDRSGIDVVAADASRNLTYIKDRGSPERYCRGPGPDVSLTASTGVNLGAPLHGLGSADVGESMTVGALALGGRNPAVLIARELMYRACELSANINADPATERAIYTQFLNAIVDISRAQSTRGVASAAAAPAPAGNPFNPPLSSAFPSSSAAPATGSGLPIVMPPVPTGIPGPGGVPTGNS